MATRAALDTKIAGVLSTNTSGPIIKSELNALATMLADYIDGSLTDSIGSVPSGIAAYVTCVNRRAGAIITQTFTLTSLPITHTDAAGSGSSGSVKIFDYVEGVIQPIASRTNLSWLGDALIDTNAGDMAFKFGLGSVAANAGDGALTGTEVDFAAISGTITLSSKAAAATTIAAGAGTLADGTATAVDLYLNESGTAATSDANGVLTVSGTITLVVAFVGDD